MEEPVVWSNHDDVHSALARLGLTVEILQRAVQAGHVSRISRTQNDAPIAHGFYQWNDTVRTLREQLAPKGWNRNNNNGLPTVVNASATIAICVSSGNEITGVQGQSPTTKHPKGPWTAVYVESNATQVDMFSELGVPAPAPVRLRDDDYNIATWTLLFYNDVHEIRSEISLPIFIAGGVISGWKERIILPAIPLDGDGFKKTIVPDFGPDVDIDIRRRA